MEPIEYTNPAYGEVPREPLYPLTPMDQYTPHKLNNEYVRPVMHPYWGLVNLGESGQIYPHPQGGQNKNARAMIGSSLIPKKEEREQNAQLPTEFAPKYTGSPDHYVPYVPPRHKRPYGD